ncbi:MAG: hypothetical protein CSB46_02540 [Micrococcales bacterium]|nr:MAG: hypothetical protein CSB46_02540 [Micrococcales bacterium]
MGVAARAASNGATAPATSSPTASVTPDSASTIPLNTALAVPTVAATANGNTPRTSTSARVSMSVPIRSTRSPRRNPRTTRVGAPASAA